MSNGNFTWVKTHEQLTQYLSTKEDSQLELIELLKSVGIDPFNDKSTPGDYDIELDEIDPFTFFCYLYKFGSKKRLKLLQEIARKLNLPIPTDEKGIPSAQAQKVWLFPYKYGRTNNEVSRLWAFFKKAITDTLTDDDFKDILTIKNIGETKLTEALFYINPTKYLPINGPFKPYLKEKLGINPTFKSYTDYIALLKKVQSKTDTPFYELSAEAFNWNSQSKKSVTRYWLYAPGEKAIFWEEYYNNGIMGLGWDELGDLDDYDSKKEMQKRLESIYKDGVKKAFSAAANFNFKETLSIGDIVFAKKGVSTYLGYGVVTSEYYYDSDRQKHQKCRKIEWKNKGNWSVDKVKLSQITLKEIKKEDADYLLQLMNDETLNMNYSLNTIFYGPPGTGKTYNTILRAAEIIENRRIDNYDEAKEIFNKNLHDRIEFITFHQNYSYEDFIQGLRPETDNKSTLVFDKKDGVFKKIADRALENIKLSEKAPSELSREAQFDIALEQFQDILLENEDNFAINDTAYIVEVEVDAFRYTGDNWANDFRMKFKDLREFFRNDVKSRKDVKKLNSISGLAKQHATYYFLVYSKIINHLPKSVESPRKVVKDNYVIIIDEINRANISRVFGELITLIEPDKRYNGAIPIEVRLPSGDPFIVPENLYIIGTMNTADKSIALLDIALRRRFEFEAMYPIHQDSINGKKIHDLDVLKSINDQIVTSKGHDFQIGHAYFMGENKDLVTRMNNKVIPLLLEYYMNDEKEVTIILSNAGLDVINKSYPLKIKGKRG